MRKPILYLIDDDSLILSAIEHKISRLENEVGIEFDVRTRPKYTNSFDLRDSDVIFMDKKMPGMWGTEAIRDLREHGNDSPIVLMTGEGEEGIGELLGDPGILWRVKPKFPNGDSLKKTFDELRNKRLLKIPIKVAFLGAGFAVTRAVERLIESPEFEKIYINSIWLQNSKDWEKSTEDHRNGMGSLNTENVEYLKTPREILDAEPDVIVVATGEHDIPYGIYKDRLELTDRLMKGSLEKIMDFLELASEEGTKSLIAMFTNPVGPMLYAAKTLGLNPGKMTGISANSHRMNVKMVQVLGKERYIDLMRASYTCEHFTRGILIEGSSYDGQRVKDIMPSIETKEMRSKMEEEIREKGLKDMQADASLEQGYKDGIDALVGFLEDVATPQEETRDTIYHWFGGGEFGNSDPFFLWPGSLQYPSLEPRRSTRSTLDLLSNEVYSEFLTESRSQQEVAINGLKSIG